MRGKLSLIIRILLAIFGVAFILGHIDWVDKVEVRPGAVLNNIQVTLTTTVTVLEGDVDPARQTAPLTVGLPDGTPNGGVTPVVITPAQLADTDHFVLRPSFKTTLRHAKIGYLALGFLLVLPIYPIQTYRWLLLMRARGLDATFGNAFKLTMVGNFFSFCLPGATGGDVVKAYYAAKRPDRRSDAIMTVIFDRVAGLVGLVLLAGIVGLTMTQDPLARKVTMWVWAGMGAMIVGAAAYFSRRIRKSIGLDWLISKLPMREIFEKIDNSAVAYRDHKTEVLIAVAMSVPVHFLLAVATALAGKAMGMETSYGLLLTVVPVVFLSAAIPITPPQGAGVWEYLGKAMLLNPPLVTMNQIVAMFMMIRIYQLLYSLTGSFFLLRGGIRLHPQEADAPLGESKSTTETKPA